MTFIHNVFFFSVVFLFIYGCCLLYFYQSNVPRGLVILLVHAGWSFVDLFSHDLYYLSKSLETFMVEAGLVPRALDQGCKKSTTTFMSCLSFPHLVCCVYGVLCRSIRHRPCMLLFQYVVQSTCGVPGSSCLLEYPLDLYRVAIAIRSRLICCLLPYTTDRSQGMRCI